MRLWIKILSISIVVFAFLFLAIYIFLFFKGKAIVLKQLEGITQKKVSIGYFGLMPPFNLQIKNLNIEGLLEVDTLFISPSILGLLTANFALNEIKMVRPRLIYEKALPKIMGLPGSTDTGSLLVRKPKKKRSLRLIFKSINIKDGEIYFIDRTVSQEGIKIIVKDINFNLTNLYIFPRSVITNFAIKAKIPWQSDSEEGKIEVEGWLNLFKKDMRATLKIADIDGVYLYPYYAKWVDLEKARIEKAKLNFTSDIHGLNNNLTAECHLELTDIVFKQRLPEEETEKAERIAAAVLDIFKALNKGRIVLDFTIRTKMDRPEFGFDNIKMAFEEKLASGKKNGKFKTEDILMLPAKLWEGMVKGATDISKAMVNGTVAVGKEVQKVIESTFKKENKEETEQ